MSERTTTADARRQDAQDTVKIMGTASEYAAVFKGEALPTTSATTPHALPTTSVTTPLRYLAPPDPLRSCCTLPPERPPRARVRVHACVRAAFFGVNCRPGPRAAA